MSDTELCIGGPRASECPEGYEVAKAVLEALIEIFHSNYENISNL